MDPNIILQNLLSPPILFFALGLIARFVKSDLAIPPIIAQGLSVYLLFAIGFHGGVELNHSGFGEGVFLTLFAAVVASLLLPIIAYFVLRLSVGSVNAAAIGACYGSISAVTFITAISFLESIELAYSGYLIAAMALMESPAIVSGVILARWATCDKEGEKATNSNSWRDLLHEAAFNGAVVLLLGSLVIGYLTGDSGWEKLAPLVDDPFQGLLCLFLLDMGLVAAKRLSDLREAGLRLVAFSLIAPPVQAMIGILTAWLLGLQPGDALLLAVLFGSASYIAVPAALRMALPAANPSLYIPMALGITFPFNIIIGIPLYMTIIELLWI